MNSGKLIDFIVPADSIAGSSNDMDKKSDEITDE